MSRSSRIWRRRSTMVALCAALGISSAAPIEIGAATMSDLDAYRSKSEELARRIAVSRVKAAEIEETDKTETELAETESETEILTEAETETETVSEIETESETETETETETESETETETETETGTETESETETETETEAETETETETETESETESEAAIEILTESETETETEIETESEAETETESETEAETESETEAATEPETETEAETEPETETEFETETETESETETETETEPETESETKPETEAETESEAESETESETEPDIASHPLAGNDLSAEQQQLLWQAINPIWADAEAQGMASPVTAAETEETEALTETEREALTEADETAGGGSDGAGSQGDGRADDAEGSGSDGAGSQGDGRADDAEGSADGLDGEEIETGAETESDAAAGDDENSTVGLLTEALAPAGQESATSVWQRNPARLYLTDYRMLREYPLPYLPDTLSSLTQSLTSYISTCSGTWSVYVKDLHTGQSLLIGEQPMKSASVMKLFVMAAIYNEISLGRLEKSDEVRIWLRDMIVSSSNTAANKLLLTLGDGSYAEGVARVNYYIRTHGYSSLTHEYNGFDDPDSFVDPSHSNQVCAADVGRLLELMYSRQLISSTICSEMESLLLDQQTRYKIPGGIPEDSSVRIANKTGEMSTVENDAAIVYGPDFDYILVVLSSDWDTGADAAHSAIREISSRVYAYFG